MFLQFRLHTDKAPVGLREEVLKCVRCVGAGGMAPSIQSQWLARDPKEQL